MLCDKCGSLSLSFQFQRETLVCHRTALSAEALQTCIFTGCSDTRAAVAYVIDCATIAIGAGQGSYRMYTTNESVACIFSAVVAVVTQHLSRADALACRAGVVVSTQVAVVAWSCCRLVGTSNLCVAGINGAAIVIIADDQRTGGAVTVVTEVIVRACVSIVAVLV